MAQENNTFKIFVKWGLGFLISLVFIWLTSWYFIGSLGYVEKDKTIGRYFIPPGTVYRYTEEGWGKTWYGKYGIQGINDATKITNDIYAIWSDSFILADQVDLEKKIFYVATEMAKSNGWNMTFVGLGSSGYSMSDYYFMMPKYEKLLSPKCNFVILHDMDDTIPDGKYFVAKPYFHFVERHDVFHALPFIKFCENYKLHFVFKTIANTLKPNGKIRSLRFRPSPVNITHQTKKKNIIMKILVNIPERGNMS